MPMKAIIKLPPTPSIISQWISANARSLEINYEASGGGEDGGLGSPNTLDFLAAAFLTKVRASKLIERVEILGYDRITIWRTVPCAR